MLDERRFGAPVPGAIAMTLGSEASDDASEQIEKLEGERRTIAAENTSCARARFSGRSSDLSEISFFAAGAGSLYVLIIKSAENFVQEAMIFTIGLRGSAIPRSSGCVCARVASCYS